MTVVGLHPEELFDKLIEGELTPSERERLMAHLEGCEVCRFEHAARADFQAEALRLAPGDPPALLPVRAPAPQAVPTPRRRSRPLVWGLAAAALISASGALASAMTGKAPWSALSITVTRSAESKPPVARTAPAKRAAATVATRPAAIEAAPPVAAVVAAPAAADEAPPVMPLSAAFRAGATPHAHSASPTHKEPTRKEPSGSVASAVNGSSDDTAAREKEPLSAGKLFTEANQARRAGDIGRASGLYHLLQEQFPGSSEAQLSRVTLSLLLLDSGDAQGALVGFERYLAGASSGLEAEALVGRARALGRLGRRDLEAKAWQEVQRKYPSSIYGRQAGERLSALGLP
jgi:TolA-binding protein